MGAPADIRAGRVVGGYRIERTLGRGGMSTVYVARDLTLARDVALKVISPELAEDGRFIERFRAESRIAAAVEHPAVLPVYDAGEADGAFYIAMRLVRGRDLRTLLREDGPLEPAEALALLRPIAEALDAAHALGLVHRDVKPGNVLVGDDGRAYLSDFGLAKTASAGTGVSRTDGLVGTVEYVSPEQIHGEELDGRADQYSLACVLFECVARQSPFARDSELATLWAHVEEVAPLPSIRAGVPPAFDEALTLALAKAPQARFASCGELLDRAGSAGRVVPRPSRPPFPGLAAFDADDAPYFFGRERLVAELVARLEDGGFTALVGPSGSGKSSVLRAGLLPALSQRRGDRGHVLLRPGARPSSALTHALDGPGGGARVIAVDQFEEVFTACDDEADRGAFVARLVAAASGAAARAVVVAMRADYFGHCAAYPALAELVGTRTVLVGPLTREEQVRAIEGPAARAGLTVERGLADALLDDVGGAAGALPLLSTALLELWHRREARSLSLRAYRETGGVRAAVARLAEETYATLTPPEQDAARRILLRLADTGEHGDVVRRRLPLAELDADRGADVGAAVAALTSSRLVTVDEGFAEVAHEALFREWPRLRAWLEDDAEGRAVRRRLTDAATAWDAAGRDAGDLLRGARLASALEWNAAHATELNEVERSYLAASREAAGSEAQRERRTSRRLRTLLAVTGMLLVGVSLAVVVALRQRADARRVAVAAEAQRLAALARSEPNFDRSLLVAREATALSDSVEARGALLASLLRAPAAVGMFRPIAGRLTGVAAAPVGNRLLVWDRDSGALVDTVSGRVLARPALDRGGFTGDGRRVMLVSVDAVRYLDARDGRLLRTWRYPPSAARYRDVSGDGETALTVARDGSAVVGWDTHTSERRFRLPSPRGQIFLAARFTRDGQHVVTVSHDRRTAAVTYSVWTPGSAQADAESRGSDAAVIPAVTGDGRLLAERTAGARALTFTDTTTGRRVTTRHLEKAVLGVAFSPRGPLAASGGDDGVVRLWDARTGAEDETLKAHRGRVQTPAFGNDGASLYTAGADGVIIAWDIGGRRRLDRPFYAGPAGEPWVAVSPDGRLVATARPGSVVVTDGQTLRRRATLRGGGSDIAFTADGSRLASAGRDGVTVWDTTSLLPARRFDVPGEPVAVAFSPDGETLAAASADGRVATWIGGARSHTIDLDGGVRDLAFDPDGNHLAVAVDDPGSKQLGGYAVVFDARTLKERYRVDIDSGYGRAGAVAFSPDGVLLATAGGTGEVRFFDASAGRRRGRTALAGAGWLLSLDFARDGATLAVGTAGGTLRLVDVAAREQIGPPLPARGDASVRAAFTRDGTQLIAVASNGRGVRWDVGLARLEARACAVAGRTLTRGEWARLLPRRRYDPSCRQ